MGLAVGDRVFHETPRHNLFPGSDTPEGVGTVTRVAGVADERYTRVRLDADGEEYIVTECWLTMADVPQGPAYVRWRGRNGHTRVHVTQASLQFPHTFRSTFTRCGLQVPSPEEREILTDLQDVKVKQRCKSCFVTSH